MSRPLEILEVVGTIRNGGVCTEVCATARAIFNAETSRLDVALDAFTRPVDMLQAEHRERPAWLPLAEVAREGVSWNEWSALAHDVFHRWAAKVRAAIPSLAAP